MHVDHADSTAQDPIRVSVRHVMIDSTRVRIQSGQSNHERDGFEVLGSETGLGSRSDNVQNGDLEVAGGGRCPENRLENGSEL